MRAVFFIGSFLLLSAIAGVSFFWSPILVLLVFLLPIIGLGLKDAYQTKRAILRNFPVVGHMRFLLEAIRPEIQQYFIESDVGGAPVPRETRSVVYQRAKQQTDTLPFGTQRNVYEDGYEWLSHSLSPKHINTQDLRVLVGGPQCKKPYSASVFNISAMSYGALSSHAIQALNGGAKLGGFYHNTGEGGVSPHHLSGGGDLVWQIGTGYFGCRTDDGNFSADLFQATATHENIKMIEIKLSQGAKPAHGGILPAAKITPEIADIRKVKPGADVISPPAHRAFSTPMELLHFVQTLRELSAGKPIGFKMCVGRPHEFVAICKAMVESQIYPDFITIDGGEGGTGAAPLEFSNSVGAPLEEGLTFVHDVLIGFDLRKHIRLIASGKIMTAFNIFSRMALGADICNSARGMMLSLGCIQARQCNTNHCPTGVATSNKNLVVGLVPSDKKVRVYNYHRHTLYAFAELLGAAGLESTKKISRHHVNRRGSDASVKSYADLFPYTDRGSFLAPAHQPTYAKYIEMASPYDFAPAHIQMRKAS
ncbi:MAG: FMN-binding glutamate synthase family protein [Bdellovibrionaceae bacterium]|nr:FMN-binding glutamate synthase family protein [Pseudobdellovibrionaceae bacterium]